MSVKQKLDSDEEAEFYALTNKVLQNYDTLDPKEFNKIDQEHCEKTKWTERIWANKGPGAPSLYRGSLEFKNIKTSNLAAFYNICIKCRNCYSH